METSREQELADAILALTYSELMGVAQSLCDMHGDMPRDLSKAEDWAEILNSWAKNFEPAA